MKEQFRIESLIPQPYSDLKRVSLTLRVSGLPPYGIGSRSLPIQFWDMPEQASESGQAAEPPNAQASSEQASPNSDRSESPFPDVELNILDEQGTEVAGTYIVEHKEPDLDFTLHLRRAEPGAAYVARAKMTLNDETLQVVEVPFELVR